METPAQIAERVVNGENTALVEANRPYWVKRITQSITVAVASERERCAAICDEGAQKHEGDTAAVLMTTADLIRDPVNL